MAAERDKESNLWGWLRDGLPRMPERKHVHRIEDTTKSGTPDVEGCVEGGSPFWMELKVGYERVRPAGVLVKTTAFQVHFAMKRAQVGGLSWYLIRVGKHPQRAHYLIPGHLADELLDKVVSLQWLQVNSACAPNASVEHIVRIASGKAPHQ